MDDTSDMDGKDQHDGRHLIRDLPPAVPTPDLPGAGGTRSHPASERRGTTDGRRRTVDRRAEERDT